MSEVAARDALAVIAIDGPAGAGKSAKAQAGALPPGRGPPQKGAVDRARARCIAP